MTVTAVFTSALHDLDAVDLGPLPDRLARACVAALPVDGAGVSYSLLPDRRLPLVASDPEAAAAERLQYATGEGPYLTAQRRRLTVVAPLSSLQTGWPVFCERLTTLTSYRTVIAFPVGGPLGGAMAVDLYCRHPEIVGLEALDDLPVVADLVGAALVEDLARDDDVVLGVPTGFRTRSAMARNRIWVAVGHLRGQHQVDTSTALAVLRAEAFHHDLDLEGVADRVLSGELVVPDPGRP